MLCYLSCGFSGWPVFGGWGSYVLCTVLFLRRFWFGEGNDLCTGTKARARVSTGTRARAGQHRDQDSLGDVFGALGGDDLSLSVEQRRRR